MHTVLDTISVCRHYTKLCKLICTYFWACVSGIQSFKNRTSLVTLTRCPSLFLRHSSFGCIPKPTVPKIISQRETCRTLSSAIAAKLWLRRSYIDISKAELEVQGVQTWQEFVVAQQLCNVHTVAILKYKVKNTVEGAHVQYIRFAQSSPNGFDSIQNK